MAMEISLDSLMVTLAALGRGVRFHLPLDRRMSGACSLLGFVVTMGVGKLGLCCNAWQGQQVLVVLRVPNGDF